MILTSEYKCNGCSEICEPVLVDMGFSYSGTHCTHGRSGFHSDKRMVSDCCDDDFEEVEHDEVMEQSA